MEPAALILAAGASSRMRGRDKLLEPVGGEPLLARQVRIAGEAGLEAFVALPPAPHPRHDALPEGVRRIPVRDAAEGMGRSIAAGVGALREAPVILLLLADLPEIETADILAVLAAREAEPGALVWRGATADGRGGHPILFAPPLYPALMALRGDDGGRSVVASAGARVRLRPSRSPRPPRPRHSRRLGRLAHAHGAMMDSDRDLVGLRSLVTVCPHAPQETAFFRQKFSRRVRLCLEMASRMGKGWWNSQSLEASA